MTSDNDRGEGMFTTRSTILGLGAGATAMIAIIGFISLVIPLLQSDPPPFVGRENFNALAQNFQQMQTQLQTTADTLQRVNEKQDRQDLDYWRGQLAIAEARLKISPNDELARGMLNVANGQITTLVARISTTAR